MIGLDEIRRYAMSLPAVEEGPPVPAARRIASFKVGGTGFLGVEKGERTITVSLGAAEAKKVVAKNPDAYEEIWRMGKTFAGLRVDLSKTSVEQVKSLIEMSWRHRAPKGVVAGYDKST